MIGLSHSCCAAFTALIGSTGSRRSGGLHADVAYDPQYVLSADKKEYLAVTGKVATQLPTSDADQHDVLGGPRHG